MAITLPPNQSLLALPIQSNNFIALQSVQLAAGTSSVSVTFTDIPGTLRLTAKITNSGANGCYLSSGNDSATAVTSSGTPQPTSGTGVVANCDYIGAGAILTQDFIQGTNTFAAICGGTASTSSTILEITVGYGQ